LAVTRPKYYISFSGAWSTTAQQLNNTSKVIGTHQMWCGKTERILHLTINGVAFMRLAQTEAGHYNRGLGSITSAIKVKQICRRLLDFAKGQITW